MKEPVTVQHAAQLLSEDSLVVSEGDIIDLIESGKLFASKSGGSYRMDREALQEYWKAEGKGILFGIGSDAKHWVEKLQEGPKRRDVFVASLAEFVSRYGSNTPEQIEENLNDWVRTLSDFKNLVLIHGEDADEDAEDRFMYYMSDPDRSISPDEVRKAIGVEEVGND